MCGRDVVLAWLLRVEHEFLKGWQQFCEPLAHGLAAVVYAIAIMNANGVTRKIWPFRPFPGRRHRPHKARPKLIEMLEGEEDRGRAYIERMQKKLLMQAMVCGHYFHKLLERNRQKARHF